MWSTGDQLGIYTEKSEKNVKYTNAATISAAEAIFKASTKVSGNPVYAYYPTVPTMPLAILPVSREIFQRLRS
jgi:hypothetical protein